MSKHKKKDLPDTIMHEGKEREVVRWLDGGAMVRVPGKAMPVRVLFGAKPTSESRFGLNRRTGKGFDKLGGYERFLKDE